MNAIVECVPNFSEGRRQDVIKAIVDAMTSAAPVKLLDVSSDPDHNRTVVTFIGAPDEVENAAFAGIRKAAELIDLNVHKGEHPRMGASDVVPFIPIRGISMQECVLIAKRLGERVGRELNIPVYLYKEAATRPDRYELPDVRKGEYEGIKEAVKTDPNRKPDYGPAELGTAGATAIGARPPLIAFNAYLNTADLKIAKEIAKAVRFSSGGLRYIQASGFLVEGRAQVSMNLLDYTKTPLNRIQEMVKSEAARYGAAVAFTELVGLIPEEALFNAARWYLQLDKFDNSQVLERKLVGDTAAASSGGVSDFIDAVSAGTAAPGGGAVAALAGALAAALPEMVAKLTIGRKKFADVEPDMISVATQAEVLRKRLTKAIEDDSAAYGEVMAAYKISKESPEREGKIQAALFHAAEVPLEVIELSRDALKLAQVAAEKGNPNATTDAGSGAHMALAAAESAGLNVLTNLKSLTDTTQSGALRARCAAALADVRTLHKSVIETVMNRGGL